MKNHSDDAVTLAKAISEFGETETLARLKKGIEAGALDGVQKYEIMDAIQGRADSIRRDGESDAQAFTRAIVEDEIGKVLFKAMQRAPGPDHVPQVEKSAKPSTPQHIGPAHAKLHSMAVDHQRAHPGQSYAYSHSYIYSHPDNSALRAQVRDEHLAAAMAGIA